LNELRQRALFPNLTEARKLVDKQYKKLDEYNVRTDRENVKKLRHSLEEKLRQTIDNLTPDEDKDKLFTVYWLRVVEVVQKHMLKYIQGVQKKIEDLQPQAYHERTSRNTEGRFWCLLSCSKTPDITHRSSQRPSSTGFLLLLVVAQDTWDVRSSSWTSSSSG
jgi:hypothetical protein